ncbi:DUF1073 domain-containing protein [Pectinatus frisingensis]|uniref:phage portal protein n=1 Tax=Pectinatus frisingensis TaxID=865 RepID=UPI0018C6DC1F|nr:DUF1073 domain-containing protein [Pectinatus frisingensis]
MDYRQDGMINAINGLGTRMYDPSRSLYVVPNQFMTMEQSEIMFTENGLFRKIITLPADECLRAGFKLCTENADNDNDLNNNLKSILEDLNTESIFANALYWHRCYGGGAIYPVIQDCESDLTQPLNENGMRSIDELRIYSPLEVVPFRKNEDVTDVNYGKTETYLVNDQLTSAYFEIHASRLIVFPGETVPNRLRAERQGWGGMVAEQIFDSLVRKYDLGNKLTLDIMERMAQGILKINGLFDKLSSQGDSIVKQYLQTIDMTRHILNTLAIDSADDFDIKSISLSGIKDILDKLQMILSAVSQIPVTILFGRSPGGQNATGDSDFEQYHAMVCQMQRRILQPRLSHYIYLISKCVDYHLALPDKWHIDFKPLSIPSEKEQAEAANQNAQAAEHNSNVAKNYVAMNALDSQEIRNSGTLEELGYQLDKTLDFTGKLSGIND